jgi:glycosyltransferase involved in cell wall biosynthesis
LRIAFDGRHLATPVLRGMDRYTVGLVEQLTARGVEVTLLGRTRDPIRRSHVDGTGARVLELPDRSVIHWEQVVVPRALWAGGFDLYHAPAERGVPLASPCPVVYTLHSVTHRSYADFVRRGLLQGPVERYVGPPARGRGAWLLRLLEPWQLRRADHILTPSEFARREVVEFLHVPGRKVTATPLAAAPLFRRPTLAGAERARVLAGLGVTAPYLLYVGGYESHKNVEGLLDCFHRVRATRADLRLVLVGSRPPPRELMARAVQLDLPSPDRVCFLSGLSDVLPDLYDGAEAFVSLSWRETFGLPALEAMTRGLPCVVSGWGAGPEVVGDGGCCMDPRDICGAAAAILMVLAGNRGTWRRRAERQAARFTWEALAEKTLGCYAQCGASGRALLLQ